jgi:zinc transporter ZupT
MTLYIATQLSQELADYVMFTSAPVNLSPFRAISLNFLVGLSCVWGGLIVTLMDISNGTLGLILAFGVGSFLYLGASVSLPAALGIEPTNARTGVVLLAFLVGAVAIGLILFNHDHCEAGDEHGDDEHASHR